MKRKKLILVIGALLLAVTVLIVATLTKPMEIVNGTYQDMENPREYELSVLFHNSQVYYYIFFDGSFIERGRVNIDSSGVGHMYTDGEEVEAGQIAPYNRNSLLLSRTNGEGETIMRKIGDGALVPSDEWFLEFSE